jgi:hypothetical protein
MFKYFVCKLVEKIYEMVFMEGSGVPVLYIGHTVPKGLYPIRSPERGEARDITKPPSVASS